ncbi:sensor histidine kinase [Aequorivita marisscotiae]|uniref:histidine kinase n=1 Tax=Aequorivita marisscotiae TaxID=3040348 RepID=A0ABY8KZC8_9FLAO|nr:sensor histidine kinase [Aequorivita sp. Ant34-E75]WGF93277.1 two-component regulator propeller domain-containing protein [Aequorivita sp. Ant34-E75]
MIRLFLTMLFLCVFSMHTNAQRYQFKKYKAEEGLITNETFAILQASDYRIWISTTSGLSSFNGKTFTNYTTEDGLASNIIFSLFEDSKGRIWVGTLDNGVSYIENGKITNPKGVNFDALGAVTAMLESSDGLMYIFFVQGIAIFKDGKLHDLLKNDSKNRVEGIQNAAWYDDNTIYLASTKLGIYKMTLNPLKIENIFNEKSGINNICYSVLVDDAKNIWVGAYGELYKITNDKLQLFKFNPDDFDKNRIYGILEANENEFYLSFEGNGIGIFNKNTGHLEIINEAQGLPSKYIYQTIKDYEGNLWMTSYGEGIIRFRDTAFKIYDDSQGLATVNDIVEWNGKVVMATNEGVAILDDSQTIRQITKNGPIKNLFVTEEDNLLYNTGKAVFEHTNNKPSSKLVDEGDYNLIFKKQDKTFLFGTNTIKVRTKDSIYFINSKRSIGIEPIGNRYLLCKVSGLFQIKNKKLDTIHGLSPISNNNFRSISTVTKTEVLAGSEKKLYHISLQNDQFKIQTFNMNRFSGLKYFRALEVDGNDLWLAGRDVLIKVDLPNLLQNDSIVAKYYHTIPHFLANDIDFNSLLVTKDKTVLATSLDGVIAFNENKFTANNKPPKLNLPEILLFSEPLIDSLYSTEKSIVLPYQKNYLSFSMEAITFTNPENVKYKYRMIGLRDENQWSEPIADNNVVFSYLPPGKYTFEFTADNGYGKWQTQPYQYSFEIKVPFWKTWLFWVTVVSIITASVFVFFSYRSKLARKRNEAYTHNLIKAQEEERTRVARELHDSVGQKLMLLTKKTKNIKNQDMETLASSTLDELRSISRGLHPANLERLGPTAAIKNMINEVDANTNIFFTHQIDDIDNLITKEASLHLYRIIQEVLNNMVKHAEAKAGSVSIKKRNNTIQATIADNGKGFEVSEMIKTSASLGMKTLRERAKILNSKIDIKSQLKKGTKITLTIPI